LFPTPDVLAEASFEGIGLTRARIETLRGLSRAVADDASCLQPAGSLDDSLARLQALPGIGAWTAHYIALRALGEPDAFPASDLGLARALAHGGKRPSPREVATRAEGFRPFRAYATLRLWLQAP
ncbi:MAG: 3-methyladenine DNA glycosylase 2, partial [Polyangiales bacterium]